MISIGNLQINKLCLGDVEVTKAYLGDVQVYGLKPQPVGKYMTITVDDAEGETVIKPTVHGSITPNLQYRINSNEDWSDFVFGTTVDIHLTAGDWVQFKGNNTSGISTSSSNYLNFSISGNPVSLSGNVMSLIDGIGDTLVIPNDYCFSNLFRGSKVKTVSSYFLPATTLTLYCYQGMFINCTALEIAPELPATTLTNSCYSSMFNGCTSLVTAPELHATTLASNCYASMFDGCTSLVTAPELPATTLTNSCYSYMFNGCTSLVTAPELPATTLDDYCYEDMFNGCTALVNAPVLPATTLAYYCYYNMFCDCTSLKQAPELPATTLDDYCYLQMFNGCTSLTTAPKILPATTLASYCYNNMFYGCTSLTQAPVLPATTLASYCYMSMFIGCKSLTKAPELPATTLASYCYNNMFKGCSNLNYVKSLATDITSSSALTNWLSGVASSGTFVKPAGVSYPTGASGIPEGWMVVEEKYMTMTVLDGASGTTIAPTVTGTLSPNLQYRINNGSWNDFIVGTTVDIHAVAGDVVQFKGVNESGISTSSSNYLNFSISGNPVSLSGNVMSLIDGVGDALVIPNNYCFYRLFHGSSIKTVSPDFLPATTLTNGCYFDLFSGSPLENAPELPSLTMKDNCYRGMFYGCTSLTQAPELPATTLANGCYAFMLANCSSLVQVTALNATELAPECYRGLFQNSTSLTQAPALPATELAQGCYKQMFYGCSSLVNAPELPATTLVSNCYNTMFYNCTSLTTAPSLPATTLAEGCYQYMFWGDSSLNYVKCLATDITATNAINQWLSGVAATGTFVKKYGVEYLINSPSGIPSGWTVVEEGAPVFEPKYLTITPSEGITGVEIGLTKKGTITPNIQYRINDNDWTDWVFGTSTNIVANSGDKVQFKGNNPDGLSTSSSNYLNFSISKAVHLSGNIMSLIDGVGETTVIPCDYCFYKLFYNTKIRTISTDFLPATTLKSNCYNNMFYYCTILTQAPELPATQLSIGCYKYMFVGTLLTKAPELPATTLVNNCYQYMFDNCSKLSSIKCLAEDISARACLDRWLQAVSTYGTFIKKKGVSYPTGISGIPSGWTVEEI